MKLSPFATYLLEDAFSELDGVSVKRMFGGYGFYLDGRIFGFTSEDDELILKADQDSKAKFEERGGQQFVYTGHKNKGPVKMPYWTVPQEILEDRTELASWVRDSARLSEKKS